MAIFRTYREDLKFSSRIVYYIFKIPKIFLPSRKIFLLPLILIFIVLIIGLSFMIFRVDKSIFSDPATAFNQFLIKVGIMIALVLFGPFLMMGLYVTVYAGILGIKNFLIGFGAKKKIYLKPLKIGILLLVGLLVVYALITGISYLHYEMHLF